jgi:hypothetical protein
VFCALEGVRGDRTVGVVPSNVTGDWFTRARGYEEDHGDDAVGLASGFGELGSRPIVGKDTLTTVKSTVVMKYPSALRC